MKKLVFGIVLAFSVSACDTEGIVEPAQRDLSPMAVPVADKSAPELKTVMISKPVTGEEGVSAFYVATGEIHYSLVQGSWGSSPCNSYTMYAEISGAISEFPNEQPLWDFHGSETLPLCLGTLEQEISLTCALTGREDGAILRLHVQVTPSGMSVNQAVIETHSGDITPVAD